MTARQQYWQHLRVVHDITGCWERRLSFSGAAELALTLQAYTTEGWDHKTAVERAWDHVRRNHRGTFVTLGEAMGVVWNY